jgi:hypothetical protein
MTAFLYTCWLRAEGLSRRTYWWLARARGRGWAAVWGALADLLPDHVARDLCAHPTAPPRARRRPALVLFADLVRPRPPRPLPSRAPVTSHDTRHVP